MTRCSLLCVTLTVFFFTATPPQHLAAQEPSETWIRQLDEFGPLGNPQQAQQTWQAARDAMREQPGVLVVPQRL